MKADPEMSLYIDASQKEAFNCVRDYLTSRHMAVLSSDPPAHIRARFGQWISMSFDNGRGDVEVHTVEKNGGSYINLNFDFKNHYTVYLISSIIVAIIVYGAASWIANQRAASLRLSLMSANLLNLSIALIVFLLTMALSGYEAQQTRRKFIQEFNMFIQSLASRKR